MKQKPAETSIRGEYQQHGVTSFYRQHGAEYRNPHEPIIRELLTLCAAQWQLDLTNVLDLACGSGEATLALRDLGADQIAGVDPYTGSAYLARTGISATAVSFEQIAAGALANRSDKYSLIVCSFALHLVAESWLPRLCYQLSQTGDTLLILTPHKRPQIRSGWGWDAPMELLHKRVRARFYRTIGQG
ncbi:MAG: class I SAM-dependent methyltransferase [Anaerolineae bacterium]|nr:class I SAM-dependent methyltransferase [Anaerolineae bacterium]